MLALPRSKPSRRLRSLATMALAILSALGVSAAAVQAFTVPVSGPADAPRIKAHCGCDVTQLLLPNTAHLFMVHRSLASWVDYVVDWLSSRGLGGRRTSTSPLACPKPTGALRGRSLGPLRLGWTRARARRTLRRYGVTYNNMDNFCLAARWGIRAGYPSARLLSKLSDQQRRRVAGKIILLLTANRYYSLGRGRAAQSRLLTSFKAP